MKGVYTALVTPFEENGKIDRGAFRALLQSQKSAQVSGVVICGTTGESPTLSLEEKKTLIQLALEEFSGSRCAVIAGTGSNDTEETVEFSRWASQQGVAGVLVVTPYYNKPTPGGMLAHFRAVADAVSCEVILYNVPGRTGSSLSPAIIVDLARHPRIRTIKEATGNVELTSQILDAVQKAGQQIDILSGDDCTFWPLLAVGAVGVISVASHILPRTFMEMWNLSQSDQWQRGRELHKRFYPVFRDLFIESNPGPIKAALEHLGVCSARMRAPLVAMESGNLKTLHLTLERCGVTSTGIKDTL